MRSVSKVVAIAICLVSGSAFAANFSGKWALQVPSGRGQATVILQLNQAGNIVTGTLSPARVDAGTGSALSSEIFDPKVEGDTISFYVWRGTDKPAKQFYKGTMSGDQIDFTITGGPAPTNNFGP
jgi:hypothetical protein